MTNGMGWCIRFEGHTIAISVDESSLVLYIKLHICLIGLRDIGASRGSCKDDGNAQSKQDDSLHFFFFFFSLLQSDKEEEQQQGLLSLSDVEKSFVFGNTEKESTIFLISYLLY